jgi:transposase
MEFTHFLGVDISKNTLDISLLSDGKELFCDVITNDLSCMVSTADTLIKEFSLSKNQLLVCAEYTGMYSRPLALACFESGISLWLENPSEIKLSSGVQRSKSDRTDAKRIAKYASRFSDKARLYTPPERDIERLKALISERSMLVVDRAKYQAQLKDQKDYMLEKAYKMKKKRFTVLSKTLAKSILEIEQEMNEIILSNDDLYKHYELLTSIDGVGQQLALKMIVETRCFTRFTDPRKFCCHAGVAPFNFTSGTSQRSRNRVSNRARKDIKQLLHMASLAAIKKDGELKTYYNRKVEEGKSKMSVLNAIRAKLVIRMFAVIKRETTYIKEYKKVA